MSIFKELASKQTSFEQLTLGEVVDTNDPQQMGRVRVMCPYLGEDENTIIEDIPWATPISPLAGISESGSRGRGDDRTFGPVAYGMFNIPKVGAIVLIACVEGACDDKFRIYLGGMHPQFMIHTLPHGRYTYNSGNESTDEPAGPLSSTGDRIQPLYDSQTQAFTKLQDQKIIDTTAPAEPRKNFEYRTRGADHGVSGIDSKFVATDDVVLTGRADDKGQTFTEADEKKINNIHGYHKSRMQEGAVSSATGFVYDPQVYSWTTPGFHSVSMADNDDNCRIRIRTTHGHQIIMDDTNERVYIGTAAGKTWIELDEKGNIDIYGERNISVHAEKDINFTAGDTFRVKAKNGIHLISEDEIRIHAKGKGKGKKDEYIGPGGDIHIKSDKNLRIYSFEDTLLEVKTNLHIRVHADSLLYSTGIFNIKTDAEMNFESKSIFNIKTTNNAEMKITASGNINVKTDAAMKIESAGNMNVKTDAILNLQSGGTTNILAGGDILQTGTSVHLNGPGASAADTADSADPADLAGISLFKEAWWTNRIPEHEPWARIMTKATGTNSTDNNGETNDTDNLLNDNTHTNAGEFPYDDPDVGRIERGVDLLRNPKWHR